MPFYQQPPQQQQQQMQMQQMQRQNNNNDQQKKVVVFQWNNDNKNAIAIWNVVFSALFLVFSVFVWIFFYKILFVGGAQCKHIPWYGFGIFLFIVATIYVLISIGSLVTSSIQLSEENKENEM